MSDKPLSFAERIALRKATEGQAAIPKPKPVIIETKEEAVPVPARKFGQPTTAKPVEESPAQQYVPTFTARNGSKFGANKPLPTIDFSEAEEATVVEEAPLGKVIQSFNVVTAGKESTEGGAADELSGSEAPAIVQQLKQKIHDLAQLEGVDLRHEVGLLREMITANGDASRYLGEEDLGLFVRSLRRMTDNRVAKDMSTAKASKATKASSSTKLSASEVADALDML